MFELMPSGCNIVKQAEAHERENRFYDVVAVWMSHKHRCAIVQAKFRMGFAAAHTHIAVRAILPSSKFGVNYTGIQCKSDGVSAFVIKELMDYITAYGFDERAINTCLDTLRGYIAGVIGEGADITSDEIYLHLADFHRFTKDGGWS